MLTEKTFRSFLVLAAILVSIYLSFPLCKNLFVYSALSRTAPAHIERYDIEESSDRYYLRAHFTLEVDGKRYRAETLFTKPAYPNLPVAIQQMQKRAAESQERLAWYDPSWPQRASLERAFPTNLLLRLLMAMAVSGYFIYVYYKNHFKLEKLKRI